MGGGGGGGKGASSPAPVTMPAADPIPDTVAKEAEGKEVRDTERRKLQQLRGMGGTVLTGPLGATAAATGGGAALLGRQN